MKTSYFNHVNDTTPKEIDLLEWLNWTKNPPANLLQKYQRYQETFSREDKRKLPAITISCQLNGYRDLKNIQEKLPFICIDIDRKENRCIDFLLAKEMFMNHPSTYYTGYSCSGDGIYAIILLEHSYKLIEYFNYFQKKLLHIGINIDGSCKDYTRLRFFSHDPEAYINPNATPLKLPQPPKAIRSNVKGVINRDSQQKVEEIVRLVEDNFVDVTASYNDWRDIGAALNNEFGHLGREYFHKISQFHPEYDYQKCSKKYQETSKIKNIGLGTFFRIFSNFGIRYGDK